MSAPSATVQSSTRRQTSIKSSSTKSTRRQKKSKPADNTHPHPTSRKRKVGDSDDSGKETSTTVKRRTTTKGRSAGDPYNPTNRLVDSLRPGLLLVLIGLNPGLRTGETGEFCKSPLNLSRSQSPALITH